MKQHLFATVLLLAMVCSAAFASNSKVELLRYEYQINEDYTYTTTVTQKITVLTNYGAKAVQKQPITYYPDALSVKVLSAYSIKPDGTKIPVDPSQIFTRSATSMPSAPGFDTRVTTTVVFPTLSTNDTTYLRYEMIRKKPMKVGFATLHTPNYGLQERKQEIVINAPKNMFLRWTTHGDFHVTDQVRGNRRWIRAQLENFPEVFEENNMADLGQNLPYFLVSSVKSWDDVANSFSHGFEKTTETTPTIKALAQQITQQKQGADAARAIHNWVAQNIHYIAVFVDEAQGFEPHPVQTVLNNGYGDCKDHTAVMIALLKAVGIDAYPTLIHASNDYYSYSLPNPLQFNHVIVYIPSLELFTDPTSEYGGFGILNQYESNKFVLIGAPKPILAQTTCGKPQDGSYTSTKKITITPLGDVNGEVIIKVSGRANTGFRQLFSGAITKLIAKETLQNTEGGIGTIETSNPHDLNHDMFITANWQSPQAINIEDGESFFTVPIGIDFKDPSSVRSLIQLETRNFPTVLGAGHTHWDTVITLPKNFIVTHLPKNRHEKNAHGQYNSEYSTSNGKLFVSRDFVINKDVYSSSEYESLRTLLYAPVKDSQSVIGIKKDVPLKNVS